MSLWGEFDEGYKEPTFWSVVLCILFSVVFWSAVIAGIGFAIYFVMNIMAGLISVYYYLLVH